MSEKAKNQDHCQKKKKKKKSEQSQTARKKIERLFSQLKLSFHLRTEG